jgi:hypothetical protein
MGQEERALPENRQVATKSRGGIAARRAVTLVKKIRRVAPPKAHAPYVRQ